MSEIDTFENIDYYRNQIKHLFDLANCPDIQISTYPRTSMSNLIRAELILPSGNMIVSELVVENYMLTQDSLKLVEDKLLQEVGGQFIKESYKKRQDDSSIDTAKKYYYTIKNTVSLIEEENKFEEYQKLKSENKHLNDLLNQALKEKEILQKQLADKHLDYEIEYNRKVEEKGYRVFLERKLEKIKNYCSPYDGNIFKDILQIIEGE